ncbi:MAG: DUF2891 domain-containing protein [Halalkalicoccus sp.]|nr:DUF2891 domain-containing protein [Halalkalicoccus sp.]
MASLEEVDTEAVLSGRAGWIEPGLVDRFAEHPLSGIEREFPHYVRSVESSNDIPSPADRHPVFYGCFDWHSAIHGHWSLCRQLRLFDDHPRTGEIVESVESRLIPKNVGREIAHFEENPTFENPYGWGWLLRLAAELHAWEDRRADEWRAVLRPLETKIVDLVETEFLSRERPIRVGTHGNSAFGLTCVLDYARVVGNGSLASAATETARRFYADDRDYPIEYEPLGWDFLSPALTEADLMRRVLDGEAFAGWLGAFLPGVVESPCEELPEPTAVDPEAEDGMELHLAGLDLSRSWCLAGIAEAIDDQQLEAAFEEFAGRHAETGLTVAFTEEYAGSHWLTSFALYLVTRDEGTVAPA